MSHQKLKATKNYVLALLNFAKSAGKEADSCGRLQEDRELARVYQPPSGTLGNEQPSLVPPCTGQSSGLGPGLGLGQETEFPVSFLLVQTVPFLQIQWLLLALAAILFVAPKARAAL